MSYSIPETISEKNFKPEHYLMGFCKIPPYIAAKRQKTYYYTGNVSILTGANGRIDIPMDADSYFLVEGISLVYAQSSPSGEQNSTIQIIDNTYSQAWSNIPVLVGDISAVAGYNYRSLPYPNMCTPSTTLSAQIVNNSDSTVVYALTLQGRKFYDITNKEMAFLKRRLFYQYALSFSTTNNTTSNANLQILNDSDFLLRNMVSRSIYLASLSTDAANALAFNIRDTSADRNFFSANLDYRAFLGDYGSASLAANPYLLRPMFIGRNGLLQFTIANTGAGTQTSQIIVLEGARTFDER